jgi:hypothetical protein
MLVVRYFNKNLYSSFRSLLNFGRQESPSGYFEEVWWSLYPDVVSTHQLQLNNMGKNRPVSQTRSISIERVMIVAAVSSDNAQRRH